MQPHEQVKFIRDIGQFVMDQILPMQKEIKELKARIAQLEASGIKYCGVYQRSMAYDRGDVCQHDSSTWIALCDVPPMTVPGKSDMWQLTQKSPRVPSHRDRPLP